MKVSGPQLRTQVGCLLVLLGFAGGLQYTASTAAFTAVGQDIAPAERTVSWRQYAQLEKRDDLTRRDVAKIAGRGDASLAKLWKTTMGGSTAVDQRGQRCHYLRVEADRVLAEEGDRGYLAQLCFSAADGSRAEFTKVWLGSGPIVPAAEK